MSIELGRTGCDPSHKALFVVRPLFFADYDSRDYSRINKIDGRLACCASTLFESWNTRRVDKKHDRDPREHAKPDTLSSEHEKPNRTTTAYPEHRFRQDEHVSQDCPGMLSISLVAEFLTVTTCHGWIRRSVCQLRTHKKLALLCDSGSCTLSHRQRIWSVL